MLDLVNGWMKAKSDFLPRQDITRDAFLGGLVQITQPQKGYRAGTDAVLLAASCPATENDIVADLGSGVGTAGLCVNARMKKTGHPLKKLYLIEKQLEIYTLAQLNCDDNNANATVTQLDIGSSVKAREKAGLSAAMVNHVVMNPPYYEAKKHQKASDDYRHTAHMLAPDISLADWIIFATWILKSKGSLSLIYPASSLPEILSFMQGRFGGITILPITSKQDEDAKRVIVLGIRDSKAPLRLLSPLILHANDGSYTSQVDAILRHGAHLDV